MRYFLFGLLLLLLPACTSDNFYRGRTEVVGQGSAQVFRVKNGTEEPVTSRYTMTGQGAATVQTVKPYLTLDGAWRSDVAGVAADEEPGAVLLRPLPPGGSSGVKMSVVTCDGRPAMLLPLPQPSAPALPLPSAAPPACSGPDCGVPGAAQATCLPVYVGCDGTAGGHRPEPVGALPKRVAPGTGWPCGAKPPEVGAAVMGALAVPPGFLLHVGECFADFVRCVFTLPL